MLLALARQGPLPAPRVARAVPPPRATLEAMDQHQHTPVENTARQSTERQTPDQQSTGSVQPRQTEATAASGTAAPSQGGQGTRAVTALGLFGGVLAVLCALAGTGMLLLKWAGFHPWAWVSQFTLLCFPVAFLALVLALLLAARARRLR